MSEPNIPRMNDPAVYDRLEQAGREYTGRGMILQYGIWLGASTLAITQGLGKTSHKYSEIFTALSCVDQFCATATEVQKAKAAGIDLQIGQDTLPLVKQNLAGLDVQLIKSNIETFGWGGWPIEIFVLDAAKHIADQIVWELEKYFVSGAVIGFLDFYYFIGRDQPALESLYSYVMSNRYYIPDTNWEPRGSSAAFFRYHKRTNG
jgi:hypothetical protein